MSRKRAPQPYRQNDPSPGVTPQRYRRRIFILLLVVAAAAVLLATGRDLQTTLLTLLGVGLVAATVARWFDDDAPLPSLMPVIARTDGREPTA
jgi:hypothetical protein